MRFPTTLVSTLAIATLYCSCGSSSSGGGASGAGTGALTFAITDAASDTVARFEVELTAVQLTQTGMPSVGAMTTPMTVDLVELQDLSQVLNVMTVAPGTYNNAIITLDFTSAEVYLVGKSVPVVAIVDGDGSPVTGTLVLPITLPAGGVTVTANQNTVLELDFDLDSSVHADTIGNQITFEPAIVTRVNRADPKEVLVKGGFQAANTSGNTFDLELQTLGGSPIADVVVAVDSSTVYQINGLSFVGSAGLTALAGLPTDTWIRSFGTTNGTSGRIDATSVEAGTGTLNGGTDVVQGHIVGHVGLPGANPTLMVLGRSRNAANTVFQHNQTFTVNANFTNTNVFRRSSNTAYDTDNLNIGQRVRIFGSLSGSTMDATASTAVIRMQPSLVAALANGAVSGGTLDIDILRVGLRVPGVFVWAEGGLFPPDDDALLVTAGTLADGLGIASSTPVIVHGYFTGVANSGNDFEAIAVENHATTGAVVILHDRTGGVTVSPTITSSSISLGISGSAGTDELSIVDRGFMGTTSLSTVMPIVIQPAGSAGTYTLRDRGAITATTYTDFTEFTDEITTVMGLGANIFNINATGAFNSGAQTSDASIIMVVVD